jgi:hypothetical protein
LSKLISINIDFLSVFRSRRTLHLMRNNAALRLLGDPLINSPLKGRNQMRIPTARHLVLGTLLMLGAYFDASAVIVMGSRGCGEWVKNEKEGGWPGVVQRSWLNGYISGKAVATGIDVLRDASGQSLSLWVTNYCNSNPLDYSDDAAEKLFTELLKKIR